MERQYRDEERAVVRRAMAQGRADVEKEALERAAARAEEFDCGDHFGQTAIAAAIRYMKHATHEAEKGGRRFGEPRTMYDWVGPRPDWYTGPLRSEGDPPPGDLPK